MKIKKKEKVFCKDCVHLLTTTLGNDKDSEVGKSYECRRPVLDCITGTNISIVSNFNPYIQNANYNCKYFKRRENE